MLVSSHARHERATTAARTAARRSHPGWRRGRLTPWIRPAGPAASSSKVGVGGVGQCADAPPRTRRSSPAPRSRRRGAISSGIWFSFSRSRDPVSRGFGFSRLKIDDITTADTGDRVYALRFGSVFGLVRVGAWTLGFDARTPTGGSCLVEALGGGFQRNRAVLPASPARPVAEPARSAWSWGSTHANPATRAER